MSDLSLQRVGPTLGGSGTAAPFRADITGAQIVADAHGRFQEAALRGTLFSTGMTATSISAATFTTGTLGATGTPIIGVWNPVGSGKNLVVLQAKVNVHITAATATGAGGFMWCVGVNQSAISTGLTPFNRYSLAQSGAVAKGFAGTALTGLSGNLTVMESSAISGGPIGTFSMVGTAVGFITPQGECSIDNIDGSIVVQPGGVLALLCTTTPVAVSATSALLWEEVPIIS
jgi:hypothetical protein